VVVIVHVEIDVPGHRVGRALSAACTLVVRDRVINVLLRVPVRVAILVIRLLLVSLVLLPVGSLFALLRLAHRELVLSPLLNDGLDAGNLLEAVQLGEEVLRVNLALV